MPQGKCPRAHRRYELSILHQSSMNKKSCILSHKSWPERMLLKTSLCFYDLDFVIVNRLCIDSLQMSDLLQGFQWMLCWLLTTTPLGNWRIFFLREVQNFFSSFKCTAMISQHNLLCFVFSLSFITLRIARFGSGNGSFCLFLSVVHHLLATRRMFLREFVLIWMTYEKQKA